jgi:hypothetical protein
VLREFESDRKETIGASGAEAGIGSPVKSNAPKYRLLERYVAINVNDEK